MQNQPRVSGFREAINDDHSTTSPAYPPSYQQWVDQPLPNSPMSNDGFSNLSHSTSYKERERSMSPDILSPGMESIWSAEGDKEVVEQQSHVPIHHLAPDPLAERKPERICGFRRASFYWMLAAIALIIIALAVGLGAGLGIKHHHSTSSDATSSLNSSTPSPTGTSKADSQYYIGGALNPAYYSREGAFNGSGIALASQSFGEGDQGELTMYFQHYTGEIRWMRLTDSGWVGGDDSTIVVSNAKNGTPISAVSYVLDNASTWQIFYINATNYVNQKSNSNTTSLWVNGPLNDLDLMALDADQVGLQGCWYGNDYGDVDYVHSPLPTDGDSSNASVTAKAEVGMHLWYATDETTFQQLGWRAGDLNWTTQNTWTDKNGHAGIGCYSWAPNTTVTYVMMVNNQNTVEFWWKDTNTTLSNTTTHPINEWVNTSISIPNVHPSTSLGYTNFFYAQMNATDKVWGYNISWSAEKTSLSGAAFALSGNSIQPGLPGTHLSVSTLPTASGGDSVVVFYQVNGTDITEFQRDLDGGVWTATTLSLP